MLQVVGNNMLQNRISMPTRPRYFQLSIFSNLFSIFLDRSRFVLVPRQLPTTGHTYRHMSIKTLMQCLLLTLVRHSIYVSNWISTLSNTLPIWILLGAKPHFIATSRVQIRNITILERMCYGIGPLCLPGHVTSRCQYVCIYLVHFQIVAALLQYLGICLMRVIRTSI